MAKSSKAWENTNPWSVGILFSLIFLAVFIYLQANSSSILALDAKWLVVVSIPLLIAILRSNIIQTFKGFGIELETRLQEPVSSINLTAVEALLDLPSDAKQSVSYLERLSRSQREEIQRLTFRTDVADHYRVAAIEVYLRKLPNIRFFEVVDNSGKFITLLPADTFIPGNLMTRERLRRFLDSLAANDVTMAFSDIAITKTILDSDDILDALRQVRKSKFGFLPVVAEDSSLLGIVTKAMVESKVADEVLSAQGKK